LKKVIQIKLDHLSEKIILFSAEKYHADLNVPMHFLICLFAIEDKRFILHRGIDIFAVIRSSIINLRLRGIYEGGSTITQQLYNSKKEISGKIYRRDLSDKLNQALWALRHETRASKPKILEEYLKIIYLGKSFYGIDQATKNYFNSTIEYLSPAQSFFLAERIAAPNFIDLNRIKIILDRPIIKQYVLQDEKNIVELVNIYEMFFECGSDLEKELKYLF
jgi:membrane carboxypeptidase/penicillin-binding protein